MKLQFLIITLITFTIFFIEALIHYNFGINSEKSHKTIQLWNGYYLHIPSILEAAHISLIVFIFASITGYISAYIIHHHLD